MKYYLCITLMLFAFTLSAQSIYINFQTGYGFATEAGQANFYNSTIKDGVQTKELTSGGFGEGLYLRASIIYQRNNWFGIELGINRLLGRKLVYKHESFVFRPFPNPSQIITSNYSRRIKAFIITPQLVFTLPNESKLTPYIKTGFAIGSFMKMYSDSRSTYILNGGNPFGFTAALGTRYFVNEIVSLIVDFNLLALSYKSYNTTNANSMNEPQEAFPMSNVSLNFGLQVTF